MADDVTAASAALQAALMQLRNRIAAAQRVLVLTGAGMSAESGIPTFRDAQSGLWSRLDPEQLASEAGFRADPATVWRWYAERRAGVRGAQPNAGHRALGAYARRRPGVLTVVTQNVDDLHQRAGNTDAIRLHGDILADRWLEPCPRGLGCDVREATVAADAGADATRADAAPSSASEVRGPPRCLRCGNLVRPAVVWFGERLPEGAIDAAERAARTCDVMLVVGTSGAVWPAAGLAGIARRAGALVAMVNPHASEIDHEAQLLLCSTAARVLPRLLDAD